MSQSTTLNRRIVLNARPRGAPTASDFRLENDPVPVPEVGQVAIGDVMVGGTVSRVEASRHGDFNVGELVLGYTGWQDYAVSDGKGLTALHPRDPHPSRALGVLGMPGFTAYMGLLDIGRPVTGETVVVAAASGAVDPVVGQIAKIQGCTVVGIAGGEDKCRYVVDELGFDFCVDHRADDLPPGPDRRGLLVGTLLRKRIKMQGFIVFDDYGPRWSEFAVEMGGWVQADKVKVREDIVFGLENAPEAFIGLLEGKNFGKLVIQVAHE